MSDAPLNREQVLDKLEQLADVEHALIVEYLTVSCALGHDLSARRVAPRPRRPGQAGSGGEPAPRARCST